MGVIFRSFFAALGQIGDPAFRRVLLRGVLLTIALLVGAYAGFLGLIQWAFGESATLPLIGEVNWLGDLLSWGSLFVMILLSVFLMIPVASAMTSMFLEDVAVAVEDRHYPNAPRAHSLSFWTSFRDTINFLGVLIAANVLALIAYAFMPPFAPVIFIAMNGYLLGREYFQIAAMRHLGREGARDLRRQHSSTIWMAGILMAIPLSVPLMNLFIPILGAATFTHLYHRLR